MRLALLFLGYAAVLSHQQRSYESFERFPGWAPFQANRREIIINEETAEDFSEFLMARQAFYAPQGNRRHFVPAHRLELVDSLDVQQSFSAQVKLHFFKFSYLLVNI